MIVLVLWAGGKAVQQRTLSRYFLFGALVGAILYTFQAALFFLPVPIFLLLFFDPPSSKQVWVRYLYTFLGFLVIVIPVFFQFSYWDQIPKGTFLNNISPENYRDFLTYHFASNFLLSFIGYLYIVVKSHFVVSSFIDPVSAIFFIPGLFIAFINMKKNRFMIFLLVTFFLELFLVGTIHNISSPPITRMFIVLPWIFVFAALGLDRLAFLLSGVTARPRKVFWTLIIVIMIAVGGMNLVQATIIMRDRLRTQYFEPVVLQVFQKDAGIVARDRLEFKNYLILTDQNYGLDWLFMLQDVYRVPASKAQIQRLIVDPPVISDDWLSRIRDEEKLIVIMPSFLPESIRQTIIPILNEQGKTECELRYFNKSDPQAFMWVAPRFQNLCSP